MLYNLQPFVASEATLCLYAAYRFTTSTVIAKSFHNEIYGIFNATKELGFVRYRVDKSAMPLLAGMKQGWTRKRGEKRFHKKPITSDILKKFLVFLDPKDFDLQTLRAILCFAKFGLLRVSEYTYGKNGNCPKVSNILIVPSMEEPQYLVYRFEKSKCNQTKRKERVVCVCQCPEPCAVHEVVSMLQKRKFINPSDPLFWLKNGSSPTSDEIRNLIKSLCKLAGLKCKDFAPHQLRSGGVVDYLCAGVPDCIVQEIARWACLDSMIPYKKLSDCRIAAILKKF